LVLAVRQVVAVVQAVLAAHLLLHQEHKPLQQHLVQAVVLALVELAVLAGLTVLLLLVLVELIILEVFQVV
jgi:hypothetical protein